MNDNPRDDETLLGLASKIDDDQFIDWENEAQTARDARERAVLAELRVLASLARVYRDPDARGALTENDDAPRAVPRTWGPLTILEPIGRGAFARVYCARDNMGREVAVKLFPADGGRSNDVADRVFREGALLAKVRHHNVVVVHGVDRSDGYVGLWMEKITGRTLEEELRVRGTLGAQEAAAMGMDLCRALAAVHGRGLLHRDVKAQNVMREEGGRTVLMDFGAGSEQAANGVGPSDIAGTPLYLAPEIFEHQSASRASDVYSLGVLLYRMVTGAYPVDGADRIEIARAHRERRRARLRDARPDLPGSFVQAVEKALAPGPADRYQSTAEFEEALARAVDSRSQKPSPWSIRRQLGAVAAGIVLLALPAWWLLGRNPGVPESAAPPAASQPLRTEPVEAAGTAALAPYTVKATFFKHTPAGDATLLPGDQVAPGDALGLRLETSTPLHVYVVNADDRGEKVLLFPVPGLSPSNPLPPSRAHQLPGSNGRDDVLWQVSSAGGREHFLIMASAEPMAAFEPMLKALASPAIGKEITYQRVPESVIGQLRSVGGLIVKPKEATGGTMWFGEVAPIAREVETVRGAWVRQLILQNRGR